MNNVKERCKDCPYLNMSMLYSEAAELVKKLYGEKGWVHNTGQGYYLVGDDREVLGSGYNWEQAIHGAEQLVAYRTRGAGATP